MNWVLASWLLIGLASVIRWVAADITKSVKNHDAPLHMAVLHCLARLHIVLLFYGLLWPVALACHIRWRSNPGGKTKR